MTKKREQEIAQFAAMKKTFDAIADTNGLKGKARTTAGFYFMQGIAAAQAAAAKKAHIDPIIYFALMRNSVDELIVEIK